MDGRDTTSTWVSRRLQPITLTWGAIHHGRVHQCKHCQTILLTGERNGFCCGTNGCHIGDVQPLPPLPAEFDIFINDPDISHLSRILNLIFSFASLESTHLFPTNNGPPGFFAVQGKLYHRIRSSHHNSAIRWILHDGFIDDKKPFEQLAANLPTTWIPAVRSALQHVNPFVHQVRMLRTYVPIFPNATLHLTDSGTAEVAAVINYDNTTSRTRSRSLQISTFEHQNQYIPITSRLWELLVYPLLFPHGSLGWGVIGIHDHDNHMNSEGRLTTDVATTQMWFYRLRLLCEPRFQIFGRLTNEYIVDMFTRNLETRLNYIKMNQRRLREEDARLMGVDDMQDNENVYLPASFLGSQRWASEQVSDCLAIAASLGNPTFFITMTCNPNWPEIQSQLNPGQNHTDIPIIVARVFHRKLALLIQTLKTLFPFAGRIVYCISSVEFQKRGLPHVHILIKYAAECSLPSDIDAVVSAELPVDEDDRHLVNQFMIHTHPPLNRPISRYCQSLDSAQNRICRFHYPRSLQDKTTIDNDGRVHYRRRHNGDQMVVPYNLTLIRAFKCHINFEVATTSHIFQYLFKYIHKGPDRVRYTLQKDNGNDTIDEIAEYWKARYLTSCEAAWRILGFHISQKNPAVTPLPIHLSSNNNRQYQRLNLTDTLSLLEHYFLRPIGFFSYNGQQRSFEDVSYAEYYTLFRLKKFDVSRQNSPLYFEELHDNGPCINHVIQRADSNTHLSRIQSVRPTQGEIFYLRCILQHKPIRSFTHARTVNGILHPSFQMAAIHSGYFADENEAVYAIQEAIHTLRTPRQLRLLFVHLLVNDSIPSPIQVWLKFRHQLSFDFYLQLNNDIDIASNRALQQISSNLEEHGATLEHYGLPQPDNYCDEVQHEILRWKPNLSNFANDADRMYYNLNHEQREIYDCIMRAISNNQGLCKFIDGKAGRGKTYLVNALCNRVRGQQKIVLTTATSAFAAQQYLGGRTTHSTFKIPINDNNQLLESPIQPDHSRGELIRTASLIIWDEAPTANKAVFACVDSVCRKCMQSDKPFGGKVILILGDFRQTSPVIRRGSKVQIIDASIKSSPLWNHFTTSTLNVPYRNAEDPEFSTFVDKIGDGELENVPLHIMQCTSNKNDLIDFVFPPNIIVDPIACLTRSILAPTNRQIDDYNNSILDRIDGESRLYMARDTLKEADDSNLRSPNSILDYVARHTPPGLPPFTINIKKNGVYRLLRNFSIEKGLVKNARVLITDMGQRIISVRIIRPNYNDMIHSEDILIPRITFTAKLSSGHTLLRQQFPLAPSYATTFNSCQGMTLDAIGVDLTIPVFSHGQLYTALSRIRNRNTGIVRLQPGHFSTTNVTYHELLR